MRIVNSHTNENVRVLMTHMSNVPATRVALQLDFSPDTLSQFR